MEDIVWQEHSCEPFGVTVLLGSELLEPSSAPQTALAGLGGPQFGTNAPGGWGQSFLNEGNDPISGYPSSSVIFPWAGEQRS